VKDLGCRCSAGDAEMEPSIEAGGRAGRPSLSAASKLVELPECDHVSLPNVSGLNAAALS